MTNEVKNYFIVESPTFINDNGETVYQLDALTNINDLNEDGQPNNSIHLHQKSIISYEDCYKKLLIAILDNVDQNEFTNLLNT